MTSRYSEFENLKKLLPKSFAAFENLFSIIYNHIQSNKRFTDLLLKVEDEEDE